MAQDKKSFVLYSDLIHVVKKLVVKDRENKTNYAGELFLHILEYVNDLDPIPIDFIVEMAFEPIKQQLKRDLQKYEVRKQRSVENGKKGGRPKEPKKPSGLSQDKKEPKKPDSVNDNVSVNVNDSDNKKQKKHVFNFRKSLIDSGVEEQVAEDWMKVRSKLKATNTETAFNRLKTQLEKSSYSPNDCIAKAVEKSWKGFESDWMDNAVNKSSSKPTSAEHVHVKKKKTAEDWLKGM